ncbi:hypothetical protein E1B28_005915 [Marasmius oreades]|uniref:Tetraspanin n=1 Tax=Marasmius oreades TaxID=181124 RepID=A0A9P7UWA1_9AGAR|nr:uncharacterized protein E1B28_005915 [Marasmius oreades]KAG7095134.1 hypothetical protein E1B28_005915 [Marasmius oreades]
MFALLPKTFCGFLPLRYGVFALSMMMMSGAIIVTITAWAQVMQLAAHPVPLSDETALFFHSIIFTLLAMFGVLGIVAALLKKRPVLILFLALLVLHLFVGICAGAFVLSVLFRGNPPEAVKRCLNGAKDSLTNTVCANGIAIQKPVAVILYIASWLLETYTAMMIYSFVRQLAQESDQAPEIDGAPASVDEMRMPYKPSHSANNSITISNISQPAPGMNIGYAFTTVEPNFGDVSNRPMRTPRTYNYV